jgi:hypothetical protein
MLTSQRAVVELGRKPVDIVGGMHEGVNFPAHLKCPLVICREWIEGAESSLKQMASEVQLPQYAIGLGLIAPLHKVHAREVKTQTERGIC